MTTPNRSQRRARRRLVSALVVVATAATLVGCSNEAPDSASDTTVASTQAPPESTVPDDPAGAVNEGSTSSVEPTKPADDAIGETDIDTTPVTEVIESGATDPATGESLADLAAADATLPENWSSNSRGAEIRLDETALLACANNQFAFVSLANGDDADAKAWLGVASVRASISAIAEVRSSAAALANAALGDAEPQTVVGTFLSLCTDRGFEY